MSLHQADYGTALDYDAKTVIADGTVVTAEEAVTASSPSRPMLEFARAVCGHAEALGAMFADIAADTGDDRPGGIRVRWGSGPSPKDLAEVVGPIPAWLTLCHDTDMDVRYMAKPKRTRAISSARKGANEKRAGR